MKRNSVEEMRNACLEICEELDRIWERCERKEQERDNEATQDRAESFGSI